MPPSAIEPTTHFGQHLKLDCVATPTQGDSIRQLSILFYLLFNLLPRGAVSWLIKPATTLEGQTIAKVNPTAAGFAYPVSSQQARKCPSSTSETLAQLPRCIHRFDRSHIRCDSHSGASSAWSATSLLSPKYVYDQSMISQYDA